MTQKMSPQKVSKMMALYFEGYSQSQIADKLKVNQATVSLSVGKFSALSEQDGLVAAGKEYGTMNQVKALHSLAAELKATKLTVEEAKAGLKMVVVFQKCGVEQEDYQDLVQACTKMKLEGYIDSAVKLNQMEKSMGMTPDEIFTKAAATSQQLKKTLDQLQDVTGKMNHCKEDLVAIEEKKKQAGQDLAAHMKQVGLDMNRLKQVESLAAALKEASVSDKEIQVFIQRQQLLGKAGLSLENFMTILQKASVATSQDGGRELLKLISEYGGLFQSEKALQIKVEGLTKQAAGLEEQAKLKGKIEGDVVKLKAEKAGLESYVAGLHKEKDELDHIKADVSLLVEKKNHLNSEITKREEYGDSLADDIKSKEHKVGDLKELESKHGELSQSVAEIESKAKKDEKRWEIFKSLLGVIQSSSTLPELEKFFQLIPDVIEEAKQGKYSPELLRAWLLDRLAGPNLQVLKCKSCQARFKVQQPIVIPLITKITKQPEIQKIQTDNHPGYHRG